MPQLAQQAGGLIDTITTQKEAIASLTQTVARGVPALRDAAENVLELNPATSTPLLTSNANDVGLSYNSAVLAVVDQTGQEQRPLTADFVTVGNGATQINQGGFSGPSATLSNYLYVAGVGNSSVFIYNGDATATGIVRGTGASFGGVDIGNGGGIDTGGRLIKCGASQMDTGGLFGNQVNGLGAAFGGVGIDNGRVHVGGSILDGNGLSANGGNFGVCASGNSVMNGGGFSGNAFRAGATIMDGAGFAGGHLSCGATEINGGGFSGNGVTANGGNFGVVASGNSVMNGGGLTAAGCSISNGGFGTLYYYTLVSPPSERALKREESLIRNGLDVVRLLVPARWRWRAPHPAVGPETPELDPDLHASVYVDEVAEVAPELVHTRDDGTRSYDDRGLTAYLISAVQTLADRVATLTARLDALEAP